MSDHEAHNALESQRVTKFRLGATTATVGAAMLVGGGAYGHNALGDTATAAGIVAGVGLVALVAGGALAWGSRSGQSLEALVRHQKTRRERLQRARTRQLTIFPAVMLAFMAQSHQAMQLVLSGGGNWGIYLQVSLPVIYGWLVPAIVMGWDCTTRKNRRLLDDELTQSMRADSMMLAFVVLMAGATVALFLGMWRPAYGISVLPYVLGFGGASAGLRFAWLDRRAERDG